MANVKTQIVPNLLSINNAKLLGNSIAQPAVNAGN